MDRIIKYSIVDENLAIQLIRFSLEYPILQKDEWNESLEQELLSKEKDENEKIERIVKIYNTYKDEDYKIYCYIEDVSEISIVFPHYEMIPDPKDNIKTTDSKMQ